MAGIEIDGVSKWYRGQSRALDGVHLDVAPGELLVLVGPSGSGKTTLLRLIAGLETPTAGTIRLAGNDMRNVPPHQRNVALVFQSLALYGHLTVAQNLAFALRGAWLEGGAAGVQERIREVAELLRIETLLDRYPAELSGGEQQRVALGRAIVRKPAALLLDEPLSSLDGPARRALRRELKRLEGDLGVPTIYVTHDQTEALALGDRIAVLNHGKLEQVGTPEDVYFRPASRFVADLFGPQGMNFVPGQLKHYGGRANFACGFEGELPALPEATLRMGPVLCGFRPEDAKTGGGPLVGQVESVESLGDTTYLHLRVPVEGCSSMIVREGEHNHGRALPGAPVAVNVPAERLHWFDPATGQRLGKHAADCNPAH